MNRKEIERKRKWLESANGKDIVAGLDDNAIDFYFDAAQDISFSIYDADKWAWLNTLFGYDIGKENAIEILEWFYANDQDIMCLTAESKGTLQMICKSELWLSLSFDSFVTETPDFISYTWENSCTKISCKI